MDRCIRSENYSLDTITGSTVERNKMNMRRKLIDFMWIPVSKKLPKEDPYHKGESKPCLVAAGKYGVLDAYYDFESNEWIFLEEECYISTDKITHWMPMPEAPWK